MSVWYCIPSKRPPEQVRPVLERWHAQGYRIALALDEFENYSSIVQHYEITLSYPGYAQAVNSLVRHVLEADPQAEWIVTGGDDVYPDPYRTAGEIAQQCTEHFAGTSGVMQPTGDRWGATEPWAQAMYPDAPAYIDRVCGSPWLGREFCWRVYGGRGPLWPEFKHMFVDEHLQAVAQKLGILWQRRDLVHHHKHWMREGDPSAMPAFLREVCSDEHWQESKMLFERLKAGHFIEAHDLVPL